MRIWLLTAVLVISGVFLVAQKYAYEFVIPMDNGFKVLRVAHAGGGIGGETYTNSYEALEHNYQRGFRYFELDFSFTADGQLVCIHDWNDNFERIFGFPTSRIPTLAEFVGLTEDSARFRNCTLEGLAAWMAGHSDAILITDIKDDNLAGLRMVHTAIPDAVRRVIPQVYDPENIATVRAMGFSAVIWTLYRYAGLEEDVLDWISDLPRPLAVTMPVGHAETGLPRRLLRRNVPSYVHTINSAEEAGKFTRQYSVTEIYTDFLPPD